MHGYKNNVGIKAYNRSIIKYMKRLIALIGVALVMVGVRYYDAGLCSFVDEGDLTVFAHTEYTPEMFVPTGADCYRIDLYGEQDIDGILRDCMATVQIVEMDGRLIYAYSPRIPKTEWVHGKRINIMIYVGEDGAVLGVPIIKGSY